MKIVDANISDLKTAPRGRRQRSPETQKLIEAISGLKAGQAKAVVPEGSETIKSLFRICRIDNDALKKIALFDAHPNGVQVAYTEARVGPGMPQRRKMS